MFVVCNHEIEGAIPLCHEIGEKGNVCCYVIEIAGSGDASLADKYFLGQSAKSGGGDGFGAESDNEGTYKNRYPIDPERLIFDEDGITVLGYAYKGMYDYYSNGDRKRYSRDIFLPLGGAARYTDYEYSFTVYPYDGTSSSYSSSKYTKLISR